MKKYPGNEEILAFLRKERMPFNEIKAFSLKPGIYAMFFMGDEFPVPGVKPENDEIIYLGKTESSSDSRDKKTHFADGKTGSSTLRRTLGAFLMDQLELVPIPRNKSDFAKKRYTHYKFNDFSETRLTIWMKENIGMSFFEYPEPPKVIDHLETQLINICKPLLNLSKNPTNPYLQTIKAKRLECGKLAHGIGEQNQNSETKTDERLVFLPKENKKQVNLLAGAGGKSKNLYVELWETITPKILENLKGAKDTSIDMNRVDFDKVGERDNYTFNLEIEDGEVKNNISGTAVARDLRNVLFSNDEIAKLLSEKSIKINLDTSFRLNLKILR